MSDSNNSRISSGCMTRSLPLPVLTVPKSDFAIRRFHEELRHLLHVPLHRPIQQTTQVQHPREQSVVGMKVKLEQRTRGLAAGLHAVLATRKLKEGVHLKTARAAQQIL